MGERKGVNKYYPPDWTPKMGSLDKYHGTHPLRERARKLKSEGILIIRFEMPYNIWCGGCGNHIGMGVRYNAEKKKVGMYYTTPVYQFRMKCHLCDNHFEMKTDPKNFDYEIVSGARRQERRWDPTQNGQVVPEDKDTSNRLADDAMFKLEHGVNDQKKSSSVGPSLAKLEDMQTRWKDDYTLNKLLRHNFREKKKEISKQAETDKMLLAKSSLDIALLPEDSRDVKLASLIRLAPLQSSDDKQRLVREKIESQPLFESSLTLKSVDSLSGKKGETLRKLVKDCQSAKFSGLSRSLSASGIGIAMRSEDNHKESTQACTSAEKLSRERNVGNLVSYSDESSSDSM